jgi:hypothetical protein
LLFINAAERFPDDAENTEYSRQTKKTGGRPDINALSKAL